MGTVFNALRLVLGQEDALGRVLAGSTSKGARTILAEAKAAKVAGNGGVFKNFVKIAGNEVDTFNSMTKGIDELGLDKNTITALKKSSGNLKSYWQNMQRVLTGEDVGTVFSKASKDSVDTLAGKIVKSGADDVAEAATKTGVFSKLGAKIAEKIPALGKLGSKLKGKGGTLGIILSLVFEIPTIIKAFKNGDGPQQIGRSALSLGGAAAGAAAGAAIGSIVPGIGTVIGGIIGFVGSIIGSEVGNKVGDAVFGKSIEEQKEAAAAQSEVANAEPASTQVSTSTGNQNYSTNGDVKYSYGFKPVLDVKA